ncbi:MAG TPA: MFS transporter [Acetobacteraceae bacterium]
MLLRDRSFALFFAGYGISTLGTAIVPVALTFALLGSGYSASAVGTVLAAQTAPMVLLMLAGGVVGDRWPRRRSMIAADLLRCASQAILASLLALGHPSLPVLMALAACCGIGTAFYGPAESGLIPQIAGAERIKDANSLCSLSGSLAAVIGPALGGLLVGLGGASVAIGLDAASYAISAICLSLMPVRPQATPPRTSVATDLQLGWGEFNRYRWLQLVTLQQGVLNLLAFAPFFVLGPSLYAAIPDGAQTWSFIASATGVGGITGGLLVLRVRLSRPLLGVQVAVALLATPLVMLALHAPMPMLVLGSGTFGTALVFMNVLVQTSLQESIPREFLSRVSSIFSLVVMGLGPIGFALCGPAADLVGTERVLEAGAAAMLLSVAVLLFSRSVWRFHPSHGREGSPPRL